MSDIINVAIRPTAGKEDARFRVSVASSSTVLQLKEETAKNCSLTAEEQRLIYKGQVLKNEKTLSEYGIGDDHVVHMVKGRVPSSAQDQPRTADTVPAASATSAPGIPGMDIGADNPVMQAMMNNPELMRTMMQSNPVVQRMIESNPQFAEVFNNPSFLSDTMRVMSNPNLMREQMRTNDVAMRNIETMPGGYNQLRTMFQSMEDAMNTGNGSGNTSSGPPIADMLAGLGVNATSQQTNGTGDATAAAPDSTTPVASSGPNVAPLPNPWQPAGNSSMGGGAPLGLGAGLGGLGGLGTGGGAPDVNALLQNPEAMQQMSQMMSNPAMQQLLSDPAVIQRTAQMMQSDPQMRQFMNLEQQPMLQQMMNDPDQVRRLMNPEMLQAMSQSLGAIGQARGAADAAPGATPAGQQAGAPDVSALMSMLGTARTAPGGQQAPDMSALLGMLGGGGAGLGNPVAPAPVANPQEVYASQLQQLKDMGFYDEEENIRVLQATRGNVNAAVERLFM